MSTLENQAPAPTASGTGAINGHGEVTENSIPDAAVVFKDVPHDSAKAADFLFSLPDASGHRNVIAIHPVIKGKIEALPITTRDGLVAWLEAHKKWNQYFSLNTLMRAMSKKADREDVARVIAFQVDIDPFVGETPDQAKARARKRLETYPIPPSTVIDSGNGLQAIWFLTEPIEINGELARAEAAKWYNIGLERELAGDNCHNIDRILRIPFTANVPNATKRDKGRVEAPTSLVWHEPERRYSCAAFQLPRDRPKESTAPTSEQRAAPDYSGAEAGVLLKDLPDKLAPWVRQAIITGKHPFEPERWEGGTDRSAALFAVILALIDAGVDDRTIFRIIIDPDYAIGAHIRDKKDPCEEAQRQIEKAHERHQEFVAERTGGRAEIVIQYNKTDVLMDDVAEAARSLPVFQRGGKLVIARRLDNPTVIGKVKHPAGGLILEPLNAVKLSELLTTVICFSRFDKKGKLKPCGCDQLLARHYLERGVWPHQVLNGIVEAPTLRADGTLLQREGYDEQSRVLVDFRGVEFQPIEENPTREAALAALALLKEVLDEFPFVDSASLAVALAAILTALVRRDLPNAPAFGFNAPTASTGKTALCDLITTTQTGRPQPGLTFDPNPEENAKRIYAALLASAPALFIDNVSMAFDGDALCSVVTNAIYESRLLGKSQNIPVKTNTLVLFNGNGLEIRGDLVSRSVVATLDAKVENPQERRFKRDLYKYVLAHRSEFVAAGLTIMRAYHAAGQPGLDAITPCRFPDWSALVRAPLIWLGEADPMATQQAIAEKDTARDAFGRVLLGFHKAVGLSQNGWHSASDVLFAYRNPENVTLHDSLNDALPGGEINHRRIGKYLEKHQRRIVGGFELHASYDKHDKAWRYQVRPHQAELALGRAA